MPTLAAGAESMPRSGIRQVMDLAWSLPDPVIGLHVGEPSFPSPVHVIEAARAAYAAGETHYVPNAGIDALRVAIAEKVSTANGFAATPAQVVVSAGGAQALHNAFSLTLGAGDEVLIPDPGWPNYAMAVQLLQAVPVRYPLRPEHGFRPDPAELAGLVTERTRVLVVNTPSNPLGTVLPAADIEALVRLAEEHDLWLLSDECYDALTFGQPHVSPGRFDRDGRVLSAFSFSKTYAMTGLRVGYLVATEEVARQSAKLQEPLIACVNAPAQAAALAALRGPQEDVATMRDAYRERRDLALGQLDTQGMGYLTPEGAFYLWVDVRDRSRGDVGAWALDLLREQHVAVAPGTTFGPLGEGWVRLSLATATEDLLEGIRRMGQIR
ncbi:pyridoxal phosphate-dependent aminotransferase [Geodermatophilus sabuli]|uniref:Aminotransferase n=1 Tax=Geodermatophilus sabuli TaxID=1564158 RepID=A0A285EC75_9ACTN|nr:aminotransferase class I/II-fold pyridoxal phosphate-dependent enzyme [Geodermatophilus sabuli]MBB3083560.1 aspartate aminotransferase [Geodermatophilus sabuli]SNX96719.1 aspartate aminotransferase [Geodermatophilus sabuli]